MTTPRTPPTVDPAARLRRVGLRGTSQRLAVLGVLDAHPHSTADQVLVALRTSTPATTPDGRGISRQAVYDVLTAGVTAGLFRRIEPAGSPARYETRTGDNHHHLICRACGRTVDVDCAVGVAPCLDPVRPAAGPVGGFQIEEAEIVFWGRCAECTGSGALAAP